MFDVLEYFPGLYSRICMLSPGSQVCITDVRQSDCAADVIQS